MDCDYYPCYLDNAVYEMAKKGEFRADVIKKIMRKDRLIINDKISISALVYLNMLALAGSIVIFAIAYLDGADVTSPAVIFIVVLIAFLPFIAHAFFLLGDIIMFLLTLAMSWYAYKYYRLIGVGKGEEKRGEKNV